MILALNRALGRSLLYIVPVQSKAEGRVARGGVAYMDVGKEREQERKLFRRVCEVFVGNVPPVQNVANRPSRFLKPGRSAYRHVSERGPPVGIMQN